MKTLLAIFLFAIVSKTCQKSQSAAMIRGKVVHRSCATIAVQLLDEMHYELGQEKWQQADGTPSLEHVFAVANICSFPAQVKAGQEVSFVILEKDTTMDECMTCELWDNPPTQKQIVKVMNY